VNLVGGDNVEKLVALSLAAGLALSACDPEDAKDLTVESLYAPKGLFCSSGDSVLILDASPLGSIIELAPRTNTMRLRTKQLSIGDGDDLNSPTAFAVSGDLKHAYVFTPHALMRVDLGNGDRKMLEALSSEDEIQLRSILDMVVTPDEKRLLLSVEGVGIVAFDLDTHERTVVHGQDPIDSPMGIVGRVEGLALLNGDELWGAQNGRMSVLRFDADSGDVLHDIWPVLGVPSDLEADAEPDSAFLLLGGSDGVDHGIWRIDLQSGELEEVSTNRRGSGDPFKSPNEFCVNLASHQAFVLDLGIHALFAVDLISGNRTLLQAW
jgi:hypothetical protein